MLKGCFRETSSSLFLVKIIPPSRRLPREAPVPRNYPSLKTVCLARLCNFPGGLHGPHMLVGSGTESPFFAACFALLTHGVGSGEHPPPTHTHCGACLLASMSLTRKMLEVRGGGGDGGLEAGDGTWLSVCLLVRRWVLGTRMACRPDSNSLCVLTPTGK